MVSFTAHFRTYLLGYRFTLRTDHAPLTWLDGVKEPEGQVARWPNNRRSWTSRSSWTGQVRDIRMRMLLPGCRAGDDKNDESATIATLQLSSYVSANIKDKQMEDQELQLIITAKQSITPAQEAAQEATQCRELTRLLQIWDQLTGRFQWSTVPAFPAIRYPLATRGSMMHVR